MSIGPVGGVGGAGNIRQNQNLGAARPQETALPTRGDGVDVDLSAAKSTPAPPQQSAAPAPAEAKAPAANTSSVPTTLFDEGSAHLATTNDTPGVSYLSLAGGTLSTAAAGQLNTVGAASLSTLSDPTPLNHTPFAKNRNPFEETDGIAHTKTMSWQGGTLTTVGSSNLAYVGGHSDHTFAAVARNRNPFEEQA